MRAGDRRDTLESMPGVKGGCWITGGAQAPRATAWLLLLALLPTLTFFGHWPGFEIPLPGVDASIGLPFAGHTHAHGEAGAGEDHGRHCHEDSAGCSDVPFTGASGFLLLAEAVAGLAAAAPLLAVRLAAAHAPAGRTVAPEPNPPRVTLAI